MYITTIGQDSHRFEPEGSSKPLVLGGVTIPGHPGLMGNSDADVILHALTNAISGLSGINILGKTADDMCLIDGITDSRMFLVKALDTINNYTLVHVSFSIECARPKLEPHIQKIIKSVAHLLTLSSEKIGLTATTGEGLTEFGKGKGIQVTALLTALKNTSTK